LSGQSKVGLKTLCFDLTRQEMSLLYLIRLTSFLIDCRERQTTELFNTGRQQSTEQACSFPLSIFDLHSCTFPNFEMCFEQNGNFELSTELVSASLALSFQPLSKGEIRCPKTRIFMHSQYSRFCLALVYCW
jgi:hypothetical protein